jgi:cytochrome P450
MIPPVATVDTTTPVERPPQMSANPVRRVAEDVAAEWRGRGKYPPGPSDFSWARTHQIAHDPLPLLLGAYEEHGPIFSMRLLHTRVIFMLGPEANHFVTVGHPENFHWRESSFGDLIPLLGDGLLTIDDDYHDRARAIMMPAFHREQVAASMAAMEVEAAAAIDRLAPGTVADVYDWMRNLAMRIAMRALLGLDPDEAGKGAAAAEHFERALGYYGIDYGLRLLRGPGSPWRKMQASRKILDEIVFAEVARRRAEPDPERRDILSLLVSARGEGGETFSDREVRDQVMTLMFAGHDTSTSTLTFMMHELARHPEVVAKLAEEEQRVLGGATPTPEQLEREMPYLDMVLDEVLRLYPPAWIGPRRAVREFEFGGYTVPRSAYVNYVSWASHRIPEVFPDPEAFIPERFTRERKAALPRGAYVPFGGGQRICIGKRFGQTEVKLVATMLLQRRRLGALPGRTMTVRQMPTLSPKGGLGMRVLAAA